MKLLEGKVVLVTGAARGIGRSIAIACAEAGASVAFTDMNRDDNFISLETELAALGVKAKGYASNAADLNASQATVDEVVAEFGQIDVLVNNAGLVIGFDKEFEGVLEEWDIVIDTNIKGLLNITRLVTPGMVQRGVGHIINIGSIAGDAAYPGGSVYCATKAAVKTLSDGLRQDLVDTPLRVTNIKPGLVETNFSVVRYRGDKDAADNFYKGIKPLSGSDVAESVYFAASAPAHVQVAEILVLATNQATSNVTYRAVR